MTREEFHLLPLNRVVTAVNNKSVANKATKSLIRAGFKESEISVLNGEAGKEFLDLDGSRHGFFTMLMRKYQNFGPESFLIAQSEAALAHDRYIVSARTDGSEKERQQAFEVLVQYTERTIFFCGKFTISILKVGKNYSHEAEYEESLVLD